MKYTCGVMTGADGADRSARADRAGLRVRSCARHVRKLRCALRQATVINLLRRGRAQSCVGELGEIHIQREVQFAMLKAN